METSMKPFTFALILLFVSGFAVTADEPTNDAGAKGTIDPKGWLPRQAPTITYEHAFNYNTSPTTTTSNGTKGHAIINMCPPSYKPPTPWREYEFNGMKVFLWPASTTPIALLNTPHNNDMHWSRK
jgi:hypothetical protein